MEWRRWDGDEVDYHLVIGSFRRFKLWDLATRRQGRTGTALWLGTDHSSGRIEQLQGRTGTSRIHVLDGWDWAYISEVREMAAIMNRKEAE